MKNELLYKILSNSYKYVPYYKNLFDIENIRIDKEIIKKDNFTCIPLLTKNKVQKNYESIISTDIKMLDEDISISHTSGSTGKSLNVYNTSKGNRKSLMYLWMYRAKNFGIYPESRYCVFDSLNSTNIGIKIINDNKTISINKLKIRKETIKYYLMTLEEFKAEWIFTQPSFAFYLANVLEEMSLKLPESIKYIELAGEFLEKSQKKKIEEILKVKVSNHYGSTETNAIALECKNGNLHCVEGNVLVEITDKDKNCMFNKEGNVCVTTLNNFYMPFIRYEIGDRGILYDGKKCSCRNSSPILELTKYRVIDKVKLENNDYMDAYFFIDIIE
ncbi:MAG: hypothetical protein ABF289_18870 [Clostridiales bacterium]